MIFERYVFREVVQNFLGVMSILLLIYISHRFAKYLADAAAGELASNLILELLFLKLITAMVMLLPLGFFISVLLTFGRLYKDSEITAIAAGGHGIMRFFQAISWFSLGFSSIVLLLSLYIVPNAAALMEEIEAKAEEDSSISGIAPGRFKELGDGDRIFYTEEITPDRTKLENVFVQYRDRERPSIFSAKGGFQHVDRKTGDRFLVMVEGYRYEGEPGSSDYSITHYGEYAVRIKDNPVTVEKLKVETLSTLDLLNSSDPRWKAELQWRLSMPLSLVLLGMLAVLLSRTTPRQGKYAKLFNAILLYFLYSNLLGIARELIEQQDISVSIGVWPVHMLMGLLIAGMLFYQSMGKWRLAAFLARSRRSR